MLLYVGFTGDKGLRGYLKRDEEWKITFLATRAEGLPLRSDWEAIPGG